MSFVNLVYLLVVRAVPMSRVLFAAIVLFVKDMLLLVELMVEGSSHILASGALHLFPVEDVMSV